MKLDVSLKLSPIVRLGTGWVTSHEFIVVKTPSSFSLVSFFVSLSYMYLICKSVLLHVKHIQLVLIWHGVVLLSGNNSNTLHIACL